MGKAEDLVKELLIAEIKLYNDLLIKYYGDESFTVAAQKAKEQRRITVEPEQPTGNLPLTRADVINTFPSELRSQLLFTENDDDIIARSKQYLGSDIFKRAVAIVRNELGGEYVSAGKESHFKIPKRQP